MHPTKSMGILPGNHKSGPWDIIHLMTAQDPLKEGSKKCHHYEAWRFMIASLSDGNFNPNYCHYLRTTFSSYFMTATNPNPLISWHEQKTSFTFSLLNFMQEWLFLQSLNAKLIKVTCTAVLSHRLYKRKIIKIYMRQFWKMNSKLFGHTWPDVLPKFKQGDTTKQVWAE